MHWTDQIDAATARRALEAVAVDPALKAQALANVNEFFAGHMGIQPPVRLTLNSTPDGWFLRAQSEPPGTALGYVIQTAAPAEGDELSDSELELVSAGGTLQGPSSNNLDG